MLGRVKLSAIYKQTKEKKGRGFSKCEIGQTIKVYFSLMFGICSETQPEGGSAISNI